MDQNPLNFIVESLGPATHPTRIEGKEAIRFTDDSERIAFQPISHAKAGKPARPLTEGFELSGPRALLYFEPQNVKAAIVTCGGLCPGINAVIRGLVLQLWYRYGCRDILGIHHGYRGLIQNDDPPRRLDPEAVSDIHARGGTILGTSRGTPKTESLVDALQKLKIDVLFTVGGDGTMRGAGALWEEIKRRGLKISVVGLPKTIDNDIPYVRRTFGFDSAVGVATHSIHAAHVEATGVPYGVGLVKLMGRNAGYIAANACLATGHANVCLVPEVPFGLTGPGGLLTLVEKRVASRHHAVIVVAEGAGQQFFDKEPKIRDASGNVKLGDIGLFLKEQLNRHFAARGMDVSLKYIDPSYLIRSSPPNSTDQLHCLRLAQNAVHAAMAGKSGVLIGYWHGVMTHVPMKALTGHGQRINPEGEMWLSVLETTGQPPKIGGQ